VKHAAGAVIVAAALAATALAQTPSVIRITAGRADILSDSAEKSMTLGHAAEGAYLIVIQELRDWYRVEVSAGGLRAVGYVSKKVAVKVSPAEAARAIDAMRRPPRKPPGDTIVVGVELAGKTIWLKAQRAKAVPIADPFYTVESAASSEALIQTLETMGAGSVVSTPPGVTEVTWIWVTEAAKAAPVLATRQPSFYVTYGEVAGLNPNEWSPYVVRLAAAGPSWRVVSALVGPSNAAQQSQEDWEIRRTIAQNEMRASVAGLAHGIVRVTPAAALTPGEYAVVIRPAFARRAYAGRDVLGDDRLGAAFGAAWVFAVK
jgi:hypothetical protein